MLYEVITERFKAKLPAVYFFRNTAGVDYSEKVGGAKLQRKEGCKKSVYIRVRRKIVIEYQKKEQND